MKQIASKESHASLLREGSEALPKSSGSDSLCGAQLGTPMRSACSCLLIALDDVMTNHSVAPTSTGVSAEICTKLFAVAMLLAL
jgi:hypothetical protein